MLVGERAYREYYSVLSRIAEGLVRPQKPESAIGEGPRLGSEMKHLTSLSAEVPSGFNLTVKSYGVDFSFSTIMFKTRTDSLPWSAGTGESVPLIMLSANPSIMKSWVVRSDRVV
jgi:hypothetical protein